VPELVEIPAGFFLMGSSDDDLLLESCERPQHEQELPTYWIGKTPVTNAQFHMFVASDGYTNPDYWTWAGWRWRELERVKMPRYWDNSKWNREDYPVVGISWYEAVAYTCWLATQTGIPFRLPTEAEWEKAARGPEGWIWPWGNTWKARRCNAANDLVTPLVRAIFLGGTTPVYRFAKGASPYGVLDMAGNVWEWCLTRGGQVYPYLFEDEWTEAYLAGETPRAIRGGAWASGPKQVRGAYRDNDFPRGRSLDCYGMRVAVPEREA
jgi:formylglycine-generating enzyme required for sulfatase activity